MAAGSDNGNSCYGMTAAACESVTPSTMQHHVLYFFQRMAVVHKRWCRHFKHCIMHAFRSRPFRILALQQENNMNLPDARSKHELSDAEICFGHTLTSRKIYATEQCLDMPLAFSSDSGVSLADWTLCFSIAKHVLIAPEHILGQTLRTSSQNFILSVDYLFWQGSGRVK